MSEFEVDLTALRESHRDGELEEFLITLSYGQVEPAARALAEWHNAGEIDLTSIFTSLEWQGSNNRSERRWLRIFGISLERLIIDAETALLLCHQILDSKLTANKHHVFSGFEKWLVNTNIHAKSIVKLILALGKDSQLFNAAILSWGKANPGEAIACAIEQTENEFPVIRMQAIRSLGYIDGESKKNSSAKLEALLTLSKSDNSDNQLNALEAMLTLGSKSVEPLTMIDKRLHELVDESAPAIQVKLIEGLLYHPNAFRDGLKSKTLGLMKSVSKEQIQTLDQIDMILSKMNVTEDRELITDVIDGILTQGQSAPKLQVFDSFNHAILSGDNNTLGNYVVHWLLGGKYSICSELGNIFPPLDMSIYEFSLDAFELNDNEIFYLARKIFVYLMYDHGPAVSLLSACLESITQNSRKGLEVEIGDFWLRNFPGDIQLFQSHVEAFELKGLKASIKRMKGMIKSYSNPLHKLPRNPAMRPSALQRRVQAEIQHQQQRDIRKQADKQSVLGSIFHKSTLLYGRSSIVYVHRGKNEEPIRQEMQMQTYQTSTALPRMDCLYPARLNYLLHIFRSEKRPI